MADRATRLEDDGVYKLPGLYMAMLPCVRLPGSAFQTIGGRAAARIYCFACGRYVGRNPAFLLHRVAKWRILELNRFAEAIARNIQASITRRSSACGQTARNSQSITRSMS